MHISLRAEKPKTIISGINSTARVRERNGVRITPVQIGVHAIRILGDDNREAGCSHQWPKTGCIESETPITVCHGGGEGVPRLVNQGGGNKWYSNVTIGAAQTITAYILGNKSSNATIPHGTTRFRSNSAVLRTSNRNNCEGWEHSWPDPAAVSIVYS